MISADQMAKNYQAGMSSVQTQQKYVNSINAYSGNPMALAASPQAEQLYLQNVTASVQSGRRSAALLAASPQSWKTNSTTVGAQRLASGAAKAAAKMAAFYQKYLPVYQDIQNTVQGMPKGGRANAIARVSVAIDKLMSAAGKTG